LPGMKVEVRQDATQSGRLLTSNSGNARGYWASFSPAPRAHAPCHAKIVEISTLAEAAVPWDTFIPR
jgi:hypothetical protein